MCKSVKKFLQQKVNTDVKLFLSKSSRVVIGVYSFVSTCMSQYWSASVAESVNKYSLRFNKG